MVRIGVIIMTLAIVGTASSGDLPDPTALPLKAELPDPLAMFEKGVKVTTKEQWEKRRRPELKQLFEHYMYGTAPKAPKVNAKVERIDKNALGGKATLKEITLTFDGIDGPKIHLLLVIPNKGKGPHPAFVGMNFCGNHAALADPKIHLNTNWMYPSQKGVKDNKATDKSRGTNIDVWNIEDAIDRGYAVATFYSGDIDPDRADERGIQKYFAKEYDWSTVRAWAWGYSRVIDYLVTDADIDATRIIAVGHSRLGKTTLLAGAFDDRIAVVIPHQAGCGGTGPNRAVFGNKGAESVKRINTSFPHWFNNRFKQFNDEPERLPFDQHCLIALCAPRPVLLSNATEDQWANPTGQFNMLVAADPVYKLMSSKGIASKTMPAVGKLMDSPLGYWIRDGKHSMNREDWGVFMNFADKHLKGK
ncbi:MAG: acetylxylan esterase [Gemmataceae bacterium]|nr:acetylxylan esterase [Gemmataceae bacterium]